MSRRACSVFGMTAKFPVIFRKLWRIMNRYADTDMRRLLYSALTLVVTVIVIPIALVMVISAGIAVMMILATVVVSEVVWRMLYGAKEDGERYPTR